MLFVGAIQVDTVETADCEGEDELQEAQSEVEDEKWEGCGVDGGDGGGRFFVEAGECHDGE